MQAGRGGRGAGGERDSKCVKDSEDGESINEAKRESQTVIRRGRERGKNEAQIAVDGLLF